LIHRTPPKNV